MKKLVIAAMLLSVIPTTANADGEIIYCQGMVCSTTPPDPNKFANFDIKDDAGNVVTSIYGSIDYYGQPDVKTESNNTTCANCNVAAQPVYVPTPIIQESSTAILDSTTANADVFNNTITDSPTVTIATLRAQIEVLYAIIRAIFVRLGWSL